MTEPDLEGAQAGVGEAPDASYEIRCPEFHGLSCRRQRGVRGIEDDPHLSRQERHAHVDRFVEDVKVPLKDPEGFAKVSAAECRIGQQSIVAKVALVRGQLQSEASVLRRLGGKIEKCGMLVKRDPRGLLAQNMGPEFGLPEQGRRREALQFQSLDGLLDPYGIDRSHRSPRSFPIDHSIKAAPGWHRIGCARPTKSWPDRPGPPRKSGAGERRHGGGIARTAALRRRLVLRGEQEVDEIHESTQEGDHESVLDQDEGEANE